MSNAENGPDNSGPHAPSFESELLYDNDSARITTWRNVMIQSVQVADLAYVRALGAVMRKQLRVCPGIVVSLALLRKGMKPAASDVRREMTRLLKDTEGRVRHVLVVEDTGLLAQLLTTVIRGVILIAGNRVAYSVHGDRQDAVKAALPHIQGLESESIMEQELSKAVARCAERH